MSLIKTLSEKLENNKGHNKIVHENKALSQTGLKKGCYRCLLLVQIDKIKKRLKYIKQWL